VITPFDSEYMATKRIKQGKVTFSPPENQRAEEMADGYEVCVLMDGAAVAPMQTAEQVRELSAPPNTAPPQR